MSWTRSGRGRRWSVKAAAGRRPRPVLCALLALVWVASPLTHAATEPWPSGLLPVELRCEYLEDPLGMDVREPRLSWRLAADVRQTPSRNQRQTAYRILVASSEWRLERDEGDVWDSGFVESDQSIQIRYAGRALESGRPYYWKVRILDQHGWMSAWSAPAGWSMGLLEPGDFEAQWIGHPDDPGDARPLPARYARREFRLDSGVQRATAYVCGLGFFELYANGQKVGDHAMDPALSNYERRVFYVTFDLTGHLRYGSNAVGVVLGNGRFHAPRDGWMGRLFGHPRLWLQIDLELADGTRQRLVSDEQWRITDQGPIRANNEYDGEVYDARLALPGWDEPDFNDADWPAAVVRPAPGGVLQSQMIEPMRVTERLRPVSITPSPVEGRWLVDFGQNFYGTVLVRVDGERGDEIRMTSAYSLRADGALRTADNRGAQNTDVFILGGDGVEEWHPVFRGQGLRRVEVSGFRDTPRPEQFEGLVVHTDVLHAGGFACSNDLVNRIQRNLLWGLRSNLRSVPMDPDRDERQGWNGDQTKVSESAAYNFDVAALYAKWIDDHRHDQREDGQLPVVTPELQSQWFPEVVWPSTFTLIPEMLLNHYGERDLIVRNYTAIRLFVDYGHGLKNTGGFIPEAAFGDWLDASCMGETRRRENRYGHERRWETGATDGGLLSTAYQYRNERTLARYALLLGKPEDAVAYGAQADRTRAAFHAEFFDPDAGAYLGGTQTAQAVALAFGLVPDEHRQQVVDFLIHDIETVHGGYLSVGLVGHQWLLQALTDAGHVETAYTLLTRTGQPSWGYMVEQGATTIWERWDTDTRDPDMNSENLLVQVGDLGAWLYRSLAGIRADPEQPGYKHFFIHPHPVNDLRWVKAHHDSPHGLIVSNWARDDDTLTMEIVVPANTSATVHVPLLEAARIMESGVPASQAEGVTFLRADDDVAVYSIGSGTYRFVSHRRHD